MITGEIRSLEDERDPERREALIKRLAGALTSQDDIQQLLEHMPHVDHYSVLKGHWLVHEDAADHQCVGEPITYDNYYTLTTVETHTRQLDGWYGFDFCVCPHCGASLRVGNCSET